MIYPELERADEVVEALVAVVAQHGGTRANVHRLRVMDEVIHGAAPIATVTSLKGSTIQDIAHDLTEQHPWVESLGYMAFPRYMIGTWQLFVAFDPKRVQRPSS